jgi:rRNA-processing protein FCF1
MEIIIDTNFAISCARQKIDFFRIAEEILDERVNWVVLSAVLDEIEKISLRRGDKIRDRNAARLALEILRNKLSEKSELMEINSKIENVDVAIRDYCIRHPDSILASLDVKLRRSIRNRVLVIFKKKFLKVV